jgi:hypothetical protein
MALPSTFGYFGTLCFEAFMWSACLGWLCQTLCSYARYLGASTLHMFKINITSLNFIVDNLFMRRSFQDSAEYPQILDIVDLRSL